MTPRPAVVKKIPYRRRKDRSAPHTAHPESRFFSIDALAIHLNCSVSKVRAMIKAETLKGVKVMGVWRISKREVERQFPSN